jgi:hypothetical protein
VKRPWADLTYPNGDPYDRADAHLTGADRVPDDAVLRSPTAVPGIGGWTAGVFLSVPLGLADAATVRDVTAPPDWARAHVSALSAADGGGRLVRLVMAAYAQLLIARTDTADLRRPWEKPPDPDRPLTPGRARRGFPNVRRHIGPPAHKLSPVGVSYLTMTGAGATIHQGRGDISGFCAELAHACGYCTA